MREGISSRVFLRQVDSEGIVRKLRQPDVVFPL
jgi:hypothetical protein